MRRADVDGLHACPHVDRDDPRCSSRFCLQRIEQALGVCFSAYHACPTYHEINSELEPGVAEPPLVVVTSHGSPLPIPAPRSVPAAVPVLAAGR